MPAATSAPAMRPVQFTFDHEADFAGASDGSTWNGFLNVRVSPETRDEIVAYFERIEPEAGADLRSLPIGPDGSVDLGGGYATIGRGWLDQPAVDAAVERGKAEILEDIATGRVPASVADFASLHDYVDANEYGGLCEDRPSVGAMRANDVQNALHQWLVGRRS